MKLCLVFAPMVLTALAGCSGLGAYGAMMAQPGATGAPAAAGPTAGGAPAATSSPLEAPSESSTSTASAPPSPSSVSVTIRNSCGKTVRVFFGNKPKFGSGTYSTASSNSVQSHSFRPGDLFWIVDQSDNGVASVEVRDGTREIEIRGGCAELASR